MRLASRYTKRRVRIEIVPLIDIIFFLLATFIMVSLSMIKNEGVLVNLPTAATSEHQENRNALTISVTKEGDFYLDKEMITRDELGERLGSLKVKEADPRIFIHGDEETSFKNMMFVMDTVRSHGITKVTMRTQGDKAK